MDVVFAVKNCWLHGSREKASIYFNLYFGTRCMRSGRCSNGVEPRSLTRPWYHLPLRHTVTPIFTISKKGSLYFTPYLIRRWRRPVASRRGDPVMGQKGRADDSAKDQHDNTRFHAHEHVTRRPECIAHTLRLVYETSSITQWSLINTLENKK